MLAVTTIKTLTCTGFLNNQSDLQSDNTRTTAQTTRAGISSQEGII